MRGGGSSSDTLQRLDTLYHIRDTVTVKGAFTASVDSMQRVDTLYHIRDTVTVKGNFATSTADTIAKLYPGLKLDTVTYVKRSADSLVVTTNHAGAFALDTAKGCTTTAFGCPIHTVIDSSHLGAIPLGQNHIGYVTVDTTKIDMMRVNDTSITSAGAKSAADSVILPAYSGQKHYITALLLVEMDTLAITGSAAYNTLSATNLPSTTIARFGNALALGATGPGNGPFYLQFANPWVSMAANTATVIKISAGGTGAYWTLTVWYYHQ